MTFTPKTILLTGASQGFGKLTLQHLLDRGHQVIALIRGGEPRLASLSIPTHPRLSVIDGDLMDPGTPARIRQWVETRPNGKLDVLINNAGYGILCPIEALTADEIEQQLRVNYFAPTQLMIELLPLLRQTRGRILNVSSIAGLYAFPMYGAYCASKFALEATSEALAAEVRSDGIQMALIEPGGFRTQFSHQAVQLLEQKLKDPKPISPQNQKRIQKIQAYLRNKTQSLGQDPERVAHKLVQLVECQRIPLRTKIGYDAVLLHFLSRLLPDRIRVALIRLVFSRLF